jgi:hypothetical protein
VLCPKAQTLKINIMKRLALIVLLSAGVSAWAQDTKKDKKEASKAQTEVKEETKNPEGVRPMMKREPMSLEQRVEMRMKRLSTQLNLTDAQKKEIQPILLEQEKSRDNMISERKAMKESGKQLTMDEKLARKDQFMKSQEEYKAKFVKILDANQLKKWEEIEANRKERAQELIEKRMEKKVEKKAEKLEQKDAQRQ